MVAYKDTIATAVDTGGLNNLLEHAKIYANVKFNEIDYTIAGTELSGSTIEVGAPIPANARVLGIDLHFSAAQTSLTLSIGDNASATRYGSALTGPQTAGETHVNGLWTRTTDGDTQILLTTGGATMTAGALKGQIYYTTD